jgi:hypothetical protein
LRGRGHHRAKHIFLLDRKPAICGSVRSEDGQLEAHSLDLWEPKKDSQAEGKTNTWTITKSRDRGSEPTLRAAPLTTRDFPASNDFYLRPVAGQNRLSRVRGSSTTMISLGSYSRARRHRGILVESRCRCTRNCNRYSLVAHAHILFAESVL